MERLTHQWGDRLPVPVKLDLSFIFELSDNQVEELQNIFNSLNAYEKTGLTPAEIEQMKTEREWVSVENRLPESIRETEMFIVYDPRENELDCVCGEWLFNNSERYSHWMTLPDYPADRGEL